MKSGYKTSELYITISAMGGIIWAFVQQHCTASPAELIALILGLASAAGAYSMGRSIVKAKQDSQGNQ